MRRQLLAGMFLEGPTGHPEGETIFGFVYFLEIDYNAPHTSPCFQHFNQNRDLMRCMDRLIGETPIDAITTFYLIHPATFFIKPHTCNIYYIMNSVLVMSYQFFLYIRLPAITDITSNILNDAWEHPCDLKLTFEKCPSKQGTCRAWTFQPGPHSFPPELMFM